MSEHMPRYPVYVVSKGRADTACTPTFLAKGGVPFHIVVEPHERDAYAKAFGADNVLTLPFENLGLGSIPARNWIWQHSIEAGHERHWILDDNIFEVVRKYRARKIPVRSGIAFAAIETLVDRYENVAIAGMNYHTFGQPGIVVLRLNVHVYSCLLIRNDLPQRWRGRYNEDTDLCLQVLADGECTVLVNAFLIDKKQTMSMRGGNTSDLYDGDGRLRMARDLERAWPHVVTTQRRWNRPQHVVTNAWGKFDTPLIPKPGVDLDALAEAGPDEMGMRLRQQRDVLPGKQLPFQNRP